LECTIKSIAPGGVADIIPKIQLDQCPCDTKQLFEIHAGIILADANTTNNSHVTSQVITGAACS